MLNVSEISAALNDFTTNFVTVQLKLLKAPSEFFL
jgi:hypothetical protein